MRTQRRTYTTEFKREALRLWETSGKSAATSEAELGISAGLLNGWKQQLKRNGAVAFPGQGRRTPEQEQLRQLERENELLRQERDLLKKAVALFTQASR